MKLRFYLLFAFYTFLFLFYPGDSYYLHIFAYNRALFSKKDIARSISMRPVPVLRTPSYPFVTAWGVYVVSRESLTPIFERAIHDNFFPASTTKIVTALVAADIYSPDEIITAKNIYNDGQVMGLVENERITAENLLYGMLVYSGNDAAYTLAEAKGYNRFIELMNEKAQTLKMKNTHFTNPAGLHDTQNYSTPYDLALAARALLKNNYLSKFVSTKEITVADADFKYFHKLENINKLLGEVQGLGGLKTGYTEEAGENLISFYRNSGHDFIIVILKSTDRFQDTKTIIDWINNNVDYMNLTQ